MGAFVLPETILGIIEPSATRNPLTPITFSLGSTTDLGSFLGPILAVPTG